MKTRQEAPSCERKEDLIDYLYDEMPIAQRALFTDHLHACPSCREDLSGMQQLRGELRSWDLGTVPRLEVVIPRSKLEVLKELIGLFPVWSRGTLGLAAAAALVLIALGTVSLFKPTGESNRLAQVETKPAEVTAATAPVAPTVVTPTPATLTPELKQLINSEVARALETERQALRTQMAALDARDQEQRTQLQTVTRQLRELNTRHQQLVAAQQPSLRSIFAEYEPSSER